VRRSTPTPRRGALPKPQPGHESGHAETALTARSRTVVAARKLHRRQARVQTGTFLAEGPQAVREALATGVVERLMVTPAALERHPDLVPGHARAAPASRLAVNVISESAAQALATTVTTQGVFAVCRTMDRPWASLAEPRPTLGVMLVQDRDPGNVGTIMRTADAVGADAVLLSAGSADVYNPKAVRASAGSVFHVPHATGVDPTAVIDWARASGVQVLAADARGSVALPELLCGAGESRLAPPTMWLFGSEAHGVPVDVLSAADATVGIPIYGAAESLNVSVAASLCLYASAFAQRGRSLRSGELSPRPGEPASAPEGAS